MQRFVTYIYAYENDQKAGNTGYAKIETRGKNGRMEVHFQENKRISGEAEIEFLYLFDGKMKKISVGNLQMEDGRGMGQYTFCTERMSDTGISFEEIAGIEITDIKGQSYRSFWRDIDMSAIKKQDEVSMSENAERDEMKYEVTAKEEKQELPEAAEQESLHTMEIPMHDSFPGYTMEEIWKAFQKRKNCVRVNENLCAVPLELSDIRGLPKRYWYLGNNSFLLHGFFNYKHLLFGKLENGEWFIGVPGIYERQEQVMASIFGFSGFFHVTEQDSEEEKTIPMQQKKLRQVVWYHILES